MRIVGAQIEPYSRRFKRPLTTARGRFTHRRGWLLRLQDDHGRHGHGDAAAWPGFGSSSDDVALRIACVDQAEVGLIDSRFDAPGDIETWLSQCDEPKEVRYAIELALLDLMGQSRGCSIAALLGGGSATTVACHALATDNDIPAAAVIKLKVGARSIDDDEARVAACRSKAQAGARIRLDAGRAWTQLQAREAIERLARYDIEFIEEPLAEPELRVLAELSKLATAHNTRIALDESIGDAIDLENAIRAEAATTIVLKPMFLGGLFKTIELARTARAAGLEVVVTHALESAVGRAGVLAAATLLPGTHGLDSPGFVETPHGDFKRIGDQIAVPRGPGLGLSFDSACPPVGDEKSASDLPSPLASSAMARPDHPALVAGSTTLNYRQLLDRVTRCAGSLHARGVRPGMTVALHGRRDLSFVIHFHALAWLGACVAPLPQRIPEDERDRLLGTIAPDMVLEADSNIGPAEPLDERFWPRTERRLVVCTSGSTGVSKAIHLSTEQLLLSATASAFRLGHDPSDTWLCCLPLHHIGGLSILLRAAFYGTTVHLHDRFEAERVAAALDSGEISMVSLVPQMLVRVLDARPNQPFPTSVRTVLVGGGHVDQALLDRCATLRIPLAVSWGMTETASQIATRLTHGAGGVAGDLGPPLSFVRVDTVGETLRVRGPLAKGELLTNDRGSVDDRFHVHVDGRIDDVIISGGEKITPRDIESVLMAHRAVRRAAVLGMKSKKWGARPAALVEREPGSQLDPNELSRWCRERLSGFKVPALFAITDKLPTTELGKIARALVYQQLCDRIAEDPSLAQAFEQYGGSGGGLETVKRHEGMDEKSRGSDDLVGTGQGVAKTNAVIGQPFDRDPNVERLAHAHGPLEIGLRVDQGHAQAVALDQPLHAAVDAHEQLLVGRVTEFEDSGEKDNTRAIHFKKSRS
ncbi:MAG: AMP-binding protein, partial [Polyangiaceae bacterium]